MWFRRSLNLYNFPHSGLNSLVDNCRIYTYRFPQQVNDKNKVTGDTEHILCKRDGASRGWKERGRG